MTMQVPKALAGRDGTTLTVGVFLAFVFQATLLPIAEYVSAKIVSSTSEAANQADFKSGVLSPLVTLVLAVVVLEIVLWVMSSMRDN
jgi:hypothetical protein